MHDMSEPLRPADTAVSRLCALPRLQLGQFPTPLEEYPGLSAIAGVRLIVKREDLAGLAMGGNKVRKLEYALADPDALASDTLLTTGGPQSNHARETAAAAARLAKRCVLLLDGPTPSEPAPGNALLCNVLGATVRYRGAEQREDVMADLDELADELRTSGSWPYILPAGAANWRGVAAWALGALETWERLSTEPVDAVVMAAGTGSTLAGFAWGTALAGRDLPVWGISVGRNAEMLSTRLLTYESELAAHIGLGSTGSAVRQLVHLDEQEIGAGHGAATASGQAALRLAAAQAGLLLDLTYTAKALAGLLRLVHEGAINRHTTVLFIHTGGLNPAIVSK